MLLAILVLLVILEALVIATFLRAEHSRQTFRAALNGELDAVKKRLGNVEAKLSGKPAEPPK